MDCCCVTSSDNEEYCYDKRCCKDYPIPCCMRTQAAFNIMIYRLNRCYEYLDIQNEKLNLLMKEIRYIREMVPLVPPVGERKA